jgi:hypothetical protein
MRKKLELEEVSVALLSQEMRRKHINDQADGSGSDNSKGKNDR